MRYRADIDGLRAVAILTVVVFHALPEAMPGGFIGVDIFFVISGYLISGILLGDLRENRFSIAVFYGRRIRRIFPALVLMLAAALIAGHYILFPNEYTDLGGQTLAGTAFLSNFALWRDIGYFDIEAASKPLLHLWSLGIEEQFYIVWPLLLFLTRKNQRLALGTVVAVIVASFGLNLYSVYVLQRPTFAFYIPLTRVWELACGSLLAVWASRGATTAGLEADDQPPSATAGPGTRLANGLAIAGALLILAALVLIDKHSPFPGWRAGLPILGAVLVIAAGPAAVINRTLLSNRIAVFIGLISFPLYLWHWPLLTFQSLLWPDSPMARAGAVALAFVLATLTYLYLERPVRRARQARGRLTRALFVANCIVGALGALVYFQHLSRAVPPEAARFLAATEDWSLPPTTGLDAHGHLAVRELHAGRADEITLYIGDSHMQQYWSRLQFLAQHRPDGMRSVEFATYPGCPPLPGVNRIAPEFRCALFFDQAVERAAAAPVKAVVFEGWWEFYFQDTAIGRAGDAGIYRVNDPDRHALLIDSPEGAALLKHFARIIQSLVAEKKQVYVLLSNPTSPVLSPLSMVNRLTYAVLPTEAIARAGYVERASPVIARLREVATQAGATVVDPVDFLCQPIQCPALLPDGTPRYRDTNHLRSSFAEHQEYLDQFNY